MSEISTIFYGSHTVRNVSLRLTQRSQSNLMLHVHCTTTTVMLLCIALEARAVATRTLERHERWCDAPSRTSGRGQWDGRQRHGRRLRHGDVTATEARRPRPRLAAVRNERGRRRREQRPLVRRRLEGGTWAASARAASAGEGGGGEKMAKATARPVSGTAKPAPRDGGQQRLTQQ